MESLHAEMSISFNQSLALSDEASDREGTGDSWPGSSFNALVRFKDPWFIEAGLFSAAGDSIEDKRPLQTPSPGEGNVWVISPYSDIVVTGYHLQLGYRFYIYNFPEVYPKFAFFCDLSAGYFDIISAKREFTNYDAGGSLAKNLKLDVGPYIQPRINLMYQPQNWEHWYIGAQASYEQYFSSDVERGWSYGFVFGR